MEVRTTWRVSLLLISVRARHRRDVNCIAFEQATRAVLTILTRCRFQSILSMNIKNRASTFRVTYSQTPLFETPRVRIYIYIYPLDRTRSFLRLFRGSNRKNSNSNREKLGKGKEKEPDGKNFLETIHSYGRMLLQLPTLQGGG